MKLVALMKRYKKTSISLGIAVALGACVGAFSHSKRVAPVSWGWFGEVNDQGGVALRGYDPVAYQSGAPAKGDAAHSTRYRGVEWHFESEENRALFQASPDKYAPAFGGFCAFAVSKGFTANADPTVFAMVDGRTYVFDSPSVKADWLADSTAPQRSEDNWSRR